MFDPYSQMSAHTRKVAFLHSRKLTTWQDAVRESRDNDLNPQSEGLSSESRLFALTADLLSRFNQWRLNWSHRSDRQVGSQKHDVALKHHSQAQR
jgi:hypothetical protein